MEPSCQFHVKGGNTHIIPLHRIAAFQQQASLLGSEHYPLLLRVGNVRSAELQPVTAGALLAEVEHCADHLGGLDIPGLQFRGPDGEELGTAYSGWDDREIAGDSQTALFVTPEGIRLTTGLFPPPVGFRSGPGMPAGCYECFFTRLQRNGEGWLGLRTTSMKGSGAPVPLPAPPLPAVTRWDLANVSGTPAVALVDWIQTSAAEVLRDVIHILRSSCTESLRFRHPLQIRMH